MTDRFAEPSQRARLYEARLQKQHEIEQFEHTLKRRRERRAAAFAIAEALDLTEQIPIPAALEVVNDCGWYSAMIEGREVKVQVRANTEPHVEVGRDRTRLRSPLDWEHG